MTAAKPRSLLEDEICPHIGTEAAMHVSGMRERIARMEETAEHSRALARQWAVIKEMAAYYRGRAEGYEEALEVVKEGYSIDAGRRVADRQLELL